VSRTAKFGLDPLHVVRFNGTINPGRDDCTHEWVLERRISFTKHFVKGSHAVIETLSRYRCSKCGGEYELNYREVERCE